MSRAVSAATSISHSIDLIKTVGWDVKATKRLVVNDLAAGEWTLTYTFTTANAYTANCNAFKVTPVSAISTETGTPTNKKNKAEVERFPPYFVFCLLS